MRLCTWTVLHAKFYHSFWYSFVEVLGYVFAKPKLSCVCAPGPFCMLNSTIRFGTLLFKCLGTFLHNQNCHAFVYLDRFAC